MIAVAPVFAAFVMQATAPQSPVVSQDSVPAARAFLEAFASNPKSTRRLATKDALFVFIDMGGPYSDFLKGFGDKKPALETCSLDSLRQTATPTAEELQGYPANTFKTVGHFAIVDGVYSCKRPDGRTGFIDIQMILKANLMAMLSWVPRREH